MGKVTHSRIKYGTEPKCRKSKPQYSDTLLGMSKSNMLKHIKILVERGWIEQRRNPRNKMDKTYQYRVNIVKIQRDLLALGYMLEGYRVPLDILSEHRSFDLELRSSKTELASHESELRVYKTELRGSETEQQYQRLHTETTSEITNTNNKTEELAAVRNEIERELGTTIPSLSPLLSEWLETYGKQALIDKARQVRHKPNTRDIIALYRKAVTDPFWDMRNEVIATSEAKHDERYGNFWELFPHA